MFKRGHNFVRDRQTDAQGKNNMSPNPKGGGGGGGGGGERHNDEVIRP